MVGFEGVCLAQFGGNTDLWEGEDGVLPEGLGGSERTREGPLYTSQMQRPGWRYQWRGARALWGRDLKKGQAAGPGLQEGTVQSNKWLNELYSWRKTCFNLSRCWKSDVIWITQMWRRGVVWLQESGCSFWEPQEGKSEAMAGCYAGSRTTLLQSIFIEGLWYSKWWYNLQDVHMPHAVRDICLENKYKECCFCPTSKGITHSDVQL